MPTNPRRSRRHLPRTLFFNAAPIFPSGVAALKGEHFLRIDLWDPTTRAPYPKRPEVWHGSADATSRRHLQALHRLQRTIRASSDLKHLPLTAAILHSLDLQAKNARSPWLPQTHFRELTNLDGAFSNLGKYAINTDFGLCLSTSATWRNAKKAWSMLAMQHQPVNQTAATAEDIESALGQITDPEIRIFIMFLWLGCFRKQDTALLLSNAVSLDATTQQLKFFVQEGKGVKARQGKYHVISHCPRVWMNEISTFLASKQTNRFAKPTRLFRPSLAKDNSVLEALRLGDNKGLSLRSVRRGSIQAIADRGADEETLMRMTGHKSVHTLHRYLNWNAINREAHAKAQEAARALDPATFSA